MDDAKRALNVTEEGMRRLLVAMLSLPLLASCSTMSSIDNRAADMRIEEQRVRSYCEALLHDPALYAISGKIAPYPQDTTFEMLTDHSKPTDPENSAIVLFAKKKQECLREAVSVMRRFSPPISPQAIALEETSFLRFQFLLADLHRRVLTYGEFARKRQELSAGLTAKQQELQRLLAQQSADAFYRAQQLVNDARKAAALEEQAANQRRLNQLKESEAIRPRQPLNCTTNYFGTAAQTTCH